MNTRTDEQSSDVKAVLQHAPEEISGRLPDKQVVYLVRGANGVRKLVRCKIADDNDLESAKACLVTTFEFLKWVQGEAAKAQVTPFELLRRRRLFFS